MEKEREVVNSKQSSHSWQCGLKTTANAPRQDHCPIKHRALRVDQGRKSRSRWELPGVASLIETAWEVEVKRSSLAKPRPPLASLVQDGGFRAEL